MTVWTVIVGNIGTVYDGTNERQAREDFNEWALRSQTDIGRAGGEPVTLFKDGVIVLEHHADSLSTCDHCGAEVADVFGCPSGAELCADCFEEGRDDPPDLTDSLCFTRRQQDILGAALNQIAAMGLFPTDEVEALIETITNA